ncbi:MAG: hypothetical protein ABFD18_15335 [Syntrophomonas sp.]
MKRILGLAVVVLIIGITIFLNTPKNADNDTTTVEQLITNKNKIEIVAVFVGQEGTPVEITTKEEVKELLNLISNVSVKKLSKQEDIDFMSEGQVLLKKGIFTVQLKEKDIDSEYGFLIILPEGVIYIVDIDSMHGNKRTISYLSKSKHPNIYKWMAGKIGA